MTNQHTSRTISDVKSLTCKCSTSDKYAILYPLLAMYRCDLSCYSPQCLVMPPFNKHLLNKYSQYIVIDRSSACVHIRAVSPEDQHSAVWLIPYTTLLIGVGEALPDCDSDNTRGDYDGTISHNKRLCYFMSVGPISHHKMCKTLGPNMVPSPLGTIPISHLWFNFLPSLYHHLTYLTLLCACLSH